MQPKTARIALIVAAFSAGLASVLAVVLLVLGLNPASGPLPKAPIGGAFALIDQNRRPVTDQDLKGRPFLMFFGFTHCPEVCPTKLFEISEVLERLGPDSNKVGAFMVSLDPERDTPEILKDYLSSFNPQLVGLTGDDAAISAIARAYRVYYKKVPLDGGDYTVDHSAAVYLMDKQGQFVGTFSLNRSPEEAAQDLRRYF